MKESTPLSIHGFFAGKHVLLTGSTGFLAKAIVEKLLRDLPEIGQIYLLIRPRIKPDGTRIDARARLREEVLRNSAFSRLREKLGDNFEPFCDAKITCVEADLTRDLLGLTEAAYKDLASKLHVIINSAATVVFDERLDLALNLNTLGPQRLLALTRAANGIYVHISTAYVSGKRTGQIPENLLTPMEAIDAQLPPGEPRPTHFDVREEIAYLHQLAEQVKADCKKDFAARNVDPNSEPAKDKLEKDLVAAGMKRAQKFGWNDTYTFTKFLGEQMVFMEHGPVSTVIVRPSIIESSLREPEPGWLDGLRMADPIIIGFGKGRLPDFPVDVNIVLDIIPADFVVNTVLAAAAHIARIPAGFDLFTIASSSKNPLWFQSLYDHVRDYFLKHPFTDRAGKPVPMHDWKFPTIPQFRRMMENRYLKPARFLTAILNGPIPIPGKRKWRPRLKNTINRVEQLLYYVDIYGPYVNLMCRFEIEHTCELLESIDPAERPQFDFDPRKFHWRQYLQDIHIPGLKRNILRMDPIPRTGASQGRLLEEENQAAKDPRKTAQAATARTAPQTIVDLCHRGQHRFGDKAFLEMRRTKSEHGAAHVRLSYQETFDRAGMLAHQLAAKLGLHAGDRIALMGENCPEWALAYLAISRAGCAAVPLDRTQPVREVARLLKLVDAKALVISPLLWKVIGEELRAGQGLPPCLNLIEDLNPYPGYRWPFPDAKPNERVLNEPSSEATASILFTSGTTLEPKGVVLTHGNFVADAMAVSEVIEPHESDRFLSVLPMHHAFEFSCGFLIPMYGGATIYHLETLRGQEVLNTMKLNEITVVLGVPRLFKMFMDGINAQIQASGKRGRIILGAGNIAAGIAESVGIASARKRVFSRVHDAFGGKLRLFVSGGAALDPEIFEFFRRFGIPVCEGYGLTETSPVLTVNPLGAPKPGSVGPAVPGVEINIDNVDIDNVGEILVRGPSVMHGYWQNPAATEKAFVNGWFKTGDLGRVDEDGYLHITGRSKDVIVTSAGKKVHPDEVEHSLQNIPGVKELCVIGLPDRSGMGEEVAAVVVPENDEAKPEIIASISRLTRNLPSYQHVARVEFQNDELPKTSTLKHQRGKIRDRYIGGAKPEKTTSAVQPALTLSTVREIVSDKVSLEVEVARAVARVAQLPPADIQPHQKLQMDLGIDSIGRVDLLQHLETRLSINLPADLEGRLFTVRDVMTVVEEAAKASSNVRARRGGRLLWERASVNQDALAAGMLQTRTRKVLRGIFESVTGLIMSTHLRVKSDGLENIPKSGPFIIVANHSSHLDLPAIRKSIGAAAERLHAMAAKDYFFDTPTKSWFFVTFLNALPLDREANAAESLAVCKTVLDHGRAMIIFPEGTRSTTGELQSFKPGIGVLAIELNVPLIPAYLHGTFSALPKGRVIPRGGRIEVRFGKPVDFSELKKKAQSDVNSTDAYRRAAAILRERVEELSDLPPIGH